MHMHAAYGQDNGSTQVDEATVNALLAERMRAKMSRDFSTADRIRDELQRMHGVEVFDKERTWKAAAAAASMGGPGNAGGY